MDQDAGLWASCPQTSERSAHRATCAKGPQSSRAGPPNGRFFASMGGIIDRLLFFVIVLDHLCPFRVYCCTTIVLFLGSFCCMHVLPNGLCPLGPSGERSGCLWQPLRGRYSGNSGVLKRLVFVVLKVTHLTHPPGAHNPLILMVFVFFSNLHCGTDVAGIVLNPTRVLDIMDHNLYHNPRTTNLK